MKHGRLIYKTFVGTAMLLGIIGSLAWAIFAITRFTGTPFYVVDYIFRREWISGVVYVLVGIFSGLLSIPAFIHWVMKK